MDPVISIIIPAFNEEKAIEKTVRQFEKLTIPHEVIVSDTASTDRTVEIAKKCADKVALLPPDKKPGVSPGRNDGAAVAKGKFLVFTDSDTFVPDINEFFATIVARFNNDPKLVGISVQIKILPEVCTWSDATVSFLMNFWFLVLNNVLGVGAASGKFQLMRSDTFKKTGGFNETLSTSEDIDLFGRLNKFGYTRIMWNLTVYHEGRRFHVLGAWHTLWRWIHNGLSFWFFKKSSDTWEPVR